MSFNPYFFIFRYSVDGSICSMPAACLRLPWLVFNACIIECFSSASFSGKIPQALRARMIFPRNPEGPALPSEKRRLPTLPGSSPVCQWLYMPPFPFRTCFHYPCFHKAWNTKRAVLREDSPVLQGIAAVYMPYLFHLPIFYAGGIRIPGS